MCGIAGVWGGWSENAAQIARKMGDAMAHRGPDDNDTWLDASAEIALAHRRLAVIDVSAAGHQPMQSKDGRYVLVYNGEIYNHLEIRERLGDIEWTGHSDTETLLSALSIWGMERTLEALNGMFAFALFDRKNRELFLARDRLGEKPLYYGTQNGAFLFGSELKALRQHPRWQGEIDRNALTSYFRHGYVPAPRSIFGDVHKLPPGHWVKVSQNGRVIEAPTPYWSIESARTDQSEFTPIEAIDRLENLLSEAVRSRMLSDVPLGAFLSGGIDSSAIVALMQAQSSQPVRSFSIAFDEAEFDEAPHARAVAAHLGTAHEELYVSAGQARDVIPHIPEIWDEPFADSSQIPTYLVSKLAREHVTVSLSGDGGDELFGGYTRYERAWKLRNTMMRMPRSMRILTAGAMSSKPAAWMAATISPKLPNRVQIAGDLLRCRDDSQFYHTMHAHFRNPSALVIGGDEAETLLGPDRKRFPDFRNWMMARDAVSYLPDDILVKLDRASMAVSLESRVPLLDHRVVEFAMSLPIDLKWREGQKKWLLRQVLYRHVPRELIDRPKKGFGVPIAQWLRGPLRDWGEALLAPERLTRQSFLDVAQITEMWRTHQARQSDLHYYLWDVLMFQAWLEHQGI